MYYYELESSSMDGSSYFPLMHETEYSQQQFHKIIEEAVPFVVEILESLKLKGKTYDRWDEIMFPLGRWLIKNKGFMAISFEIFPRNYACPVDKLFT